jgi:DNA-binding NtrC family response regulator
MHGKSVLIVEDNIKLLNLMRKKLIDFGYKVEAVRSLSEAQIVVSRKETGVLILDLFLNGENGMDCVKPFLAIDPTLQIIVVTGYASVETAVQAMKDGVYDYIQKPVDIELLRKTICNAFRYRSLKMENTILKRQLLKNSYCSNSRSKRMIELLEKAKKLASTDIPILILGESGTGKEFLADYIHSHSTRSDKPIMKINSSAFPEGLLENELFGHEKDSYTGATSSYKGLFEQANNGTLFMDEIGDMSLSIQAKILRTLQNKEIRRIGALKTLHVDVRIVAATNMDLETLIADKKFRNDLYYRINTAVLHIPPLRERREDIPLLINHFLEEKYMLANSGVPPVSNSVMDFLSFYSWPGNIRELKNIIEYSTAMAADNQIDFQHLPESLKKNLDLAVPLKRRDTIDRELIMASLSENRYNKKRTAEKLGISRKTLYDKMNQYDIEY